MRVRGDQVSTLYNCPCIVHARVLQYRVLSENLQLVIITALCTLYLDVLLNSFPVGHGQSDFYKDLWFFTYSIFRGNMLVAQNCNRYCSFLSYKIDICMPRRSAAIYLKRYPFNQFQEPNSNVKITLKTNARNAKNSVT